jgi:hypothetical protein
LDTAASSTAVRLAAVRAEIGRCVPFIIDPIFLLPPFALSILTSILYSFPPFLTVMSSLWESFTLECGAIEKLLLLDSSDAKVSFRKSTHRSSSCPAGRLDSSTSSNKNKSFI